MHLKIVIFYMLLATAWFVITAIPVLLSVLLPKVPRSIGSIERQACPQTCPFKNIPLERLVLDPSGCIFIKMHFVGKRYLCRDGHECRGKKLSLNSRSAMKSASYI